MKNEKLLLFILAAVQFTHMVDFMIMMPLGDVFMKEFGIGPSQFSFIVSSYPFMATVSSLLSALFIDRFDRKHALLVNYIGFTIGTILCGFAPNFYFLVGARAVTGIFGGIMSALILSIIGDVIPNSRRATAMGMVMAAFSAASILGVPGGLLIAEYSSWHFTFWTVGVMAVVITMLIIFGVPSIRVHLEQQKPNFKPRPFKDIAVILTNKNQLTGLIFVVILIFGHFAIIPFITPYLIRNVGFTQSQIPIVYTIGGALTLVSSPLIGKLSDKFGRANIFTIVSVLALVPLVLLTNLGKHATIYIPLVVTGMLFIFFSGRMIPANTMLTSAVKARQRGSYMSLISSIRQFTSGGATLMAGLIVTESLNPETGANDGPLLHYDIVGYIAVAFSIAAIFLARRLKLVDEGSGPNEPTGKDSLEATSPEEPLPAEQPAE